MQYSVLYTARACIRVHWPYYSYVFNVESNSMRFTWMRSALFKEDSFSQLLWQKTITPNQLFRPGATVFLLKPVQCTVQLPRGSPRIGGTTITTMNGELLPYGERAQIMFVNQSQLRLRVFLEPEPALDTLSVLNKVRVLHMYHVMFSHSWFNIFSTHCTVKVFVNLYLSWSFH